MQHTQRTTANGLLTNRNLTALCALCLSVCALAGSVYAQSAPAQTPPPPAPPPAAAAPSMDALNALPTSDVVMVVNLRRILTEALPRVMPASRITEMGSFFDVMELASDIDLREIDSIALGMRMPKNISARMMPEVAIVAHGSFASAKVIGALQRVAPTKAREELYRDSKIYIFDLSQLIDTPSAAALIAPHEISLAALNTNTIAIGTLANVQRTIEAREGHGGINPALVALATRNPGSLVSLALIDLKPKDADIISTSMQSEDEIIQALNSITHLYASIEMLETEFQFLMFARTGHPKQTIPLRDVLISLTQQLGKTVKDARAKIIFNNLQIKMQSNEVQLTTRLPVEAIASLIREMQPPPTPKLDASVIVRKRQPHTRRRPRRKVH